MRAHVVTSTLLSVLLAACSGEAGSAGRQGPGGPTGPTGPTGPGGLSPWFTGPGVRITVTGLDVSATAATVSFRLTDGAGVPLDRRAT